MKGVMVDTSGWKAVYDASDEFHTQASDTWMELKRRKVSLHTTDYILDEALTLLRITVGHRLAVQFGRDVRGSRIINIIDLDSEIKEEAWKIFARYKDKKFSFTDCTTFALMKRMGITDAFAFDDHFVQFGFVVVSRKTP